MTSLRIFNAYVDTIFDSLKFQLIIHRFCLDFVTFALI